MESYSTPNMGCTASTERSEDDIQPRRVRQVNDLLLLNTSSQPPSIPWSSPVTDSGLQHGHPTLDTQTQNPGPGSNFLYQNRPLEPNLAPLPGTQHLPRSSFPQVNQQHQDPWDARGAETFYRFEHIPNRDIRRHGLNELPRTPERRPEAAGRRARMNSSKKKTTMTKACSICLDEFSGQDSIKTNLPYSCEKFCGQVICITCLKDWFVDACKNESKMPPRCCCTVPLSAISHLLSEDQIDLYKSKFEEWRTPDRFYCPVPTCSTFIPPRLMKEGRRQSKIEQTSSEYQSVPAIHHPSKSNIHEGTRQSQNENLNSGKEQTSSQYLSVPVIHYPLKSSMRLGTLQSQNEKLNPGEKQLPSSPSLLGQQFTKKDVETKLTTSVSTISIAFSTIICPKCSVSICTRCRLLQHPDAPCPQTDLDRLLATQLEKWKIKRCPKCRAGVRRMFGCSHIECRCGAHFCFSCLQPMKKCDGRCEDSDFDDDFDDEDDMSDDEFDSDDIDALMAVDGTQLNLGGEPYNPTVDTWDCTHNFKPVYKFAGILPNGRILSPHKQTNSPLDCQVCWKVLTPHLPPPTMINTNIEGLTPTYGMTPGPDFVPTTVYDEPAWRCVGKHLTCYGCSQDAMLDPKTSKYCCECNAFCVKCANVVEGDNMGENTEINLAYDCKCGLIVCGACKVKVEDGMEKS